MKKAMLMPRSNWFQVFHNWLFVRNKIENTGTLHSPTLQDNLNLAKVVYRSGKAEPQLVSLAYYYGIALNDLIDYYLFFEKFPDEDNILIIQHWGVPALIQEVMDNMASTANKH